LYLEEKNIFENIILFDAIYDEKIKDKYYIKFKNKPVFYLQNIVLLKELLLFYNPIFIYANSANIMALYNSHFPTVILNKTVFHFHECAEHIFYDITKIRNNKLFVVSENIKKDFLEQKEYTLKDVSVFPPFIGKQKLIEIEKMATKMFDYEIVFDKTKITFGMCGSRCFRKGYDIFINIAKSMPQHNFVWIGGDFDPKINLDNFKSL
jgi:hypothetical protein